MRDGRLPAHGELVARARFCIRLLVNSTADPVAVWEEVRLGPGARADLVAHTDGHVTIIEVKRGVANDRDLDQIESYVEMAGQVSQYDGLAVTGVLCAHGLTNYAASLLPASRIPFFRFDLDGLLQEILIRRI